MRAQVINSLTHIPGAPYRLIHLGTNLVTVYTPLTGQIENKSVKNPAAGRPGWSELLSLLPGTREQLTQRKGERVTIGKYWYLQY